MSLLQDLLAISLTAVNLLRPLYDPAGELIDFAPEYFNPAAQRMTGLLTERPAGTARTLFPDIFTNGIFDFYRQVFDSGEAGHFAVNYQADRLDNYFRVAAQRSGELLIVSFTDTADQERSAVEVALREAQAAEQAARAEAETQRQRFYDLLMQLPAQVAVHEGADQVFTLVNPGYQRLAPGRELQGQPIREAWPELVSQGILDVLDHVYQTGEPFIGKELPFQVDFTRTGQLEQVYFNAFFLPLRDAQGQLRGVLDYSYDVTEQVLARQHLQQFNAELEARVQERSQLAEQALATAERERTLLQIILEQSPVAIGVFQGEELRITATNAQMAALWGRTPEQVLNLPFMDAVPELRGQGFDDIMRQVLRTEVPFIGTETPADVLRGEHVQTHYYNFVYQPLYDADGQLLGAIDVAVEVTEQVLARRQVEQLNQELEARVQERTEQLREAQAAAERERALLQALLLQAPVAIALFQGEDVRVAAANAEMAAIWGYTPAQVVGRPLLEGVPELQGQGFDDLLRQVLRTQVPVTGTEAPAQLLRGGQLHTSYYNFVYQPLYDAEGQVLGVIDVAVDVTEQVRSRQQVEQLNAELETRVQVRTQEALALQAELLEAAQHQAQARESFYQVFEQTPAAVSLLRGPQYRFEYVNPVYQQVFAGRQLLGRDFAEALPDAATQGFLALLDGVYRTGETYFGDEVPFVSEPPDAPSYTTYFTFTYQAYRENGEVAGISTFALDVTEQVLARQLRDIQHRELTALFEQAPTGVCILDGPELVYTFANPAYEAILPGRTLLGRSVLDVIPELRDSEVETLLRRVYATGETYRAQEQCIPVAGPDGELENRYFSLVYQARRDQDQRITGILNLVVEVTEQLVARQQAEYSRQQVQNLNGELAAINQELTTANGELGESNRQLTRTNIDLDNFIYTASHDLKAPITNIEGLLLALEHELPAAARAGDVPLMLTMMQDAVDRFRRTIEHLTDLSRLQKEHNPASDAVDLAPVVEAVRLDLTPLLTQTQGQLMVTIPEGLTVTFAEKNLRSVVYNLLSNAFKYRHPDRVPEVQLRSWLADDYAVLEVQDNGLGLDLAQGQEKLFAMFQRLHTHVEGTGVGLYMVKRIVENAGGRIEVTSALGQGSTFRVYFPR